MSDFYAIYPPVETGGGGGGSPTIGLPVVGGDPNDVLFIDPSGNLGQDDYFQYFTGTGSLTVSSVSGYATITVGSDAGVESDGSGNAYFYNNFSSAYTLLGSDGTWKAFDASESGYIGLDSFGNAVISQYIVDTSDAQSIDTNGRTAFANDGSTKMIQWNRSDNLIMNTAGTATITGTINNTVVTLDDSGQSFDVSGQNLTASPIAFTPGFGIGMNVNDFSYSGTYTGANDTYTIVITAVGDQELNYAPVSGSFQIGDVVTGSSSGATANVDYVDGLGDLFVSSVIGTFMLSETITGSVSGATGTFNDLTGNFDVYSWSDTVGNSGAGNFVPRTGPVGFTLSNGLSGDFLNSIVGLGVRHVNDTWVFSYTLAAPSFFQANFFSNFAAIGDWESDINGVYLNSNIAAGENQVGGNLNMQGNGITNLANAVNPLDAINLSQAEALAGGITIDSTEITGGSDSAILFQNPSDKTVDEDNAFTYTNSLGFNQTLSVGNMRIYNDSTGSSFIGNPTYDQNIQMDNLGNMYFDSSFGTVAFFSASTGSLTIFNYIEDTSGAISIDSNNRTLNDSSAVQSVLYEGRELWDPSSNIILQWGGPDYFINNTTGLAIDFGNGYLQNPSINDTTLDWVAGVLFTSDSSNGESLDWTNRRCVDSGGVITINWDCTGSNGALIDSSGVLSQDWQSRILVGPGGINILDYSQTITHVGASFGGGHLSYSQIGGAVTITEEAGAGSGATVSLTSASDAAGTANLTSGISSLAAGPLVQISFARSYSVTPIVVICSAGSATPLPVSVTTVTANSFFISSATAPILSTSYSWNYFVIETH